MAEETKPLNEPQETVVITEPEKKLKGDLIVIDLPPPPKDVCSVCDPLVESDLKLAVTSTLCCWCPMGCLPMVFGISSIYYALKARDAETEEKRLMYSKKSQNISWVGMILFMGIMIAAIVILATSGLL